MKVYFINLWACKMRCGAVVSGSDLRYGPGHPGQIFSDGDLQRVLGLSVQHRSGKFKRQSHER